jgi:hypothetical protein
MPAAAIVKLARAQGFNTKKQGEYTKFTKQDRMALRAKRI